jgi:hypothetical protein
MVGGIAVAAAERTFPFRVFSFPTQIARVNPIVAGQLEYLVQPIYDFYGVAVATAVTKQILFQPVKSRILNYETDRSTRRLNLAI